MSKKNPMTPEAAARIQSREAVRNGGGVDAGSFTARAQRAAEKSQPKNLNNRSRKMAKGNTHSGKGSNTSNSSGGKATVTGGRPSTGFSGGNWPSTTGNPSGNGRGNANGRG